MSEPFDFDAFIAGTQLPRRTIEAYRVDNSDEIRRLQAEHDAMPPESDDREASGNARYDLVSRIVALREAMEASRFEFVIRTLTPQEFRDFTTVDESDDDAIFRQMALQSVEPKLTAEQWRKVSDAVGVGQWGAMVKDANELVLRRVAVPDFSRAVLQTLSPPVSSES